MRNLLIIKKDNTNLKTRILGIDPGSRIAGYAVIDSFKGKMDLIEYGILKISADSDAEKLYKLSELLVRIIQKFEPDTMAVEKVFFGKNAVSALKLGQVRGVILLLARQFSVAQFDYSPNEIKKSISGMGHASKNQIQFMAKQIFRLKEIPDADAADAIAVAVCHAGNYAYKKMLAGVDK